MSFALGPRSEQSRESISWMRLVPISLMRLVPTPGAPEAQRSIAPRFSVGKKAGIAFQPRRGDAKGEIVFSISFMLCTETPGQADRIWVVKRPARSVPHCKRLSRAVAQARHISICIELFQTSAQSIHEMPMR